MSALDWAVLLFLGLIFGASMLFINIAVKEISPAALVLLRVILGAIILGVICYGKAIPSGLSSTTGKAFFFWEF